MPTGKGKEKPPEAHCPMCGSPMAKSPAGAVMMRMMAQMGKRMQQGGMRRGGGQGGGHPRMPMRPPGMGGR